MIKSKRVLALGTIAALGFAAAACGSDDNASSSTDAPADTTGASAAPADTTAGTEAPADSTATSDAPADSTATGGSAAPAGDCKVGMAYDVTGRGDKSFNDAAALGAREGADRSRRHVRGVDADR